MKMRKKYILLEDSPELKKGAILEEKCDDGNQGFKCISGVTHDKHKDIDWDEVSYSRNTVIKSPKWFGEIKTLDLTPEQYTKVKKFLKIK